jgi:hypothetical protein
MRTASVCAIAVGALCLLASPSAKATVLSQGLAITAASALNDTIEVKKGGRGHGHGWGRGHGWGPPGFRGRHCPPGHWKKGWC